MNTTYGMADEHGQLIGYFDAADDDAAREHGRAWLANRPTSACVEIWPDTRDELGGLPPSFIVEAS